MSPLPGPIGGKLSRESDATAVASRDAAAGQDTRGGAEGPEARSDARLQLSRRLDWRFLLSDPTLGRVLYIGPLRGSLFESLRTFSVSLTTRDELPHLAGDGSFDLVVVRDASAEALRTAATVLRPGAHLYLEIDGPFSRHRRRGDLSASAARAELHRLGLVPTIIAWHWPDFESCTRIVPLGRPEALRYALRTGVGGPAALRWGLQTVLRPRVLERLAPALSMVARA